MPSHAALFRKLAQRAWLNRGEKQLLLGSFFVVGPVSVQQRRCWTTSWLVGFPGRYAGSFDLERYRIFNRAGLRLMPLPYSAWIRDAESCVRAIEERLGVAGPVES